MVEHVEHVERAAGSSASKSEASSSPQNQRAVLATLIAVAAGLAAAVASAALGNAAVIFKLAAGGCAGGLVVLGLNSLFHPETTMALATKVRTRLGIA